ncbi:site-specific integrase [Rubripirellula sp.]|nr:phage integrase SAM-like domain-containing protein [Rubripirellula sp.]MDB4644906.1 site-specific integrase [Rubripirellula sp.]
MGKIKGRNMSVRMKGNGCEIRWFHGEKRRSIYLSGISEDNAVEVYRQLSRISASMSAGLPIESVSRKWLDSLPDKMHKKLVKIGVAEDRVLEDAIPVPTFTEAARKYVDQFTGAESTRKQLTSCFGIFGGWLERKQGKADCPVSSVTTDDVRSFRAYQVKVKFAEATIRKRCSRCKQLFARLVDDEIIPSNPFNAVVTASVDNPDNMEYVEADRVIKVIQAVDKLELKLMLALCRFGGLRKHECSLIRWQDVLFDEDPPSMTISSNKTGKRICPLFPSLREQIEPFRKRAGRIQDKWEPDSNASVTALRKWADKNGVVLWKKPFQNLRASLETELFAEFPIKDVTMWLGNSPTVAMKHYAMARNHNFAAATRTQTPDSP